MDGSTESIIQISALIFLNSVNLEPPTARGLESILGLSGFRLDLLVLLRLVGIRIESMKYWPESEAEGGIYDKARGGVPRTHVHLVGQNDR